MANLQRDLPPVNAMVAFEAAGRLSSFTQAAAELGVSQAAVSRQVQALEAHLGVDLFRRLHRAVRLTPSGVQLLASVQSGLSGIAATAKELRQRKDKREITVYTTIAFASFWLMPRLERLRAAHPGVELKLVAAEVAPDLAAEGIQIGVRYGQGRWPGLEAVRLFRDEIYPVCSPAYPHGKIKKVEDLLGENLLQLISQDSSWLSWESWFRLKDVSVRQALSGPSFNNHNLVIQAAQGGQGIALGWRRLVEPLVRSGALIRPLKVTVRPAKDAYFLVLPEGHPVLPETATLRDWLRQEATQSS